MDRFDKDELKVTARGQWKSILASVCAINSEILTGDHYPCPKCGGVDRFRMLDESAGALFCNQCFTSKNGDGIAAVMWLLDCDFQSAMEKIGQFLRLKPKKRQKKSDPSKHLAFTEWNELLAATWCLKKKPIKSDSLKKIGARMAMYRKRYKVIVLPVWKDNPTNITGWCMFNITGGTLPKFRHDGSFEQVKVKLSHGSKPGLIGFINSESATVYKTEGPTDLLALLSIEPPNSSFFCNANGAKENPARAFGWLPGLVDGKEIRIIHDADKPGQEGATFILSKNKDQRAGWGPWFASRCEKSIVRNLILPFQIEPAHGKDLRDWISDGHTAADLEQLAEVDPIESVELDSITEIWEAPDDPHRLAQLNLSQYKRICGGKLVFWSSEWWKYKSGRYQKIDNDELKAKVGIFIRKEFERVWKEQKDPEKPVQKVTIGLVSNVISAMASLCSIPSSVKMPCWLPTRKRRNYLSLKNGLLDLDAVFSGKDLDECLLDHSPDWFSIFRLDYEFDPEAECPKWLKYLDDVMECDDERINLLQEWAGYLLTTQNDHQKFLVLEGEGKNGKTVFFAAMTAMLGEDNVSHVAMENFGGRFDLGVTLGKAANISGDVGEIDQLAEGILKQFTGGEIMQFDRKCIQPIQARPTAKLMCAWNSRPRIKDRSNGLWRRMLLIPFRIAIKDSERIFGMDQADWWSDETPGILLWAIAGLHRLREQRKFTRCQVSDDALADYQLDSNPAAEFFNDYLEQNDYGTIESKRLYELYQHWCKHVNCRPFGNRQFGKELRRRFPLMEKVRVKKDRKLFWHYKKISFAVEEIFEEKVFNSDLF